MSMLVDKDSLALLTQLGQFSMLALVRDNIIHRAALSVSSDAVSHFGDIF